MKTIFITGASTGLGRAAATLFADRGWNVIATMRKPENGADLAAHKRITVLPLDVTKPEQIEAAVAKALEMGPVDVVFNNAGYGLAGPFEGATDAELVAELDTNLLGTMRVTQAFIPHFRTRGSGTFVATTSIGGHVTFPFNSVYHATKWGLEGWSESLWYELSKFGIEVKTVAPGGISTDFAGRSLVLTDHPAYKALREKAIKVFMDPKRAKDYSTAEQIAEVVYEAATDGKKKKITYIAGKDAKGLFRMRKWLGQGWFVGMVNGRFFEG